jgi:hypothetical protein
MSDTPNLGGEVISKEIIHVDIDTVHPNEYNPNEQSEAIFNEFVEEIKKDGFVGALDVAPKEIIDGVQHYTIIGGEHRWRALKVLGADYAPVCVFEDWDENEQKLKTIRRNSLTGTLNTVKFTKLVKSLDTKKLPKHQEMHTSLGFATAEDLAAHMLKEKNKVPKSFIDDLTKQTKKQSKAVEGLTDIVSNIFGSCADTIDMDMMHFVYGGKAHTVVLCDKATVDELEKMYRHLKKTGQSANDFMKAAIESHLLSDVSYEE